MLIALTLMFARSDTEKQDKRNQHPKPKPPKTETAPSAPKQDTSSAVDD